MASEPTRSPSPWSLANLSVNVVGSLLAAGLCALIVLLPFASIPKFIEPIRKALSSPAPVWLVLTLGLVGWAVTSFRRRDAKRSKRAPAVAPGDVRTVLAAWLSNASSVRLDKLISYVQLDEELGLPSGSSRRLLKDLAAQRNRYPKEEGEGTILLEYRSPPSNAHRRAF